MDCSVADTCDYAKKEEAEKGHPSKRRRGGNKESIRNARYRYENNEAEQPDDFAKTPKEGCAAYLDEGPDRLHDEEEEKGGDEYHRANAKNEKSCFHL